MVDGNGKPRREVLQSALAAGIGLTGVGSVQGSIINPDDSKADSAGTAVVRGTSDSADKVKNTKEDYKQSLNALDLDSRIGTRASSPGDPTREHLEYLDHREESETLETDIMKVADVNYMLTAYEAVDDNGNSLTDSNGDYYYVLELLAVSDEADGPLRNPGQTTSLMVKTELDSSGSMQGRDPRTTSDINGGYVTLSAGATIAGHGVSVSTEQWVEHGDFGPETWTPGPSGEYGVMFDGETPGGGQTDIIGFASVTLSHRAIHIWNIIDSWSWESKGNHIQT